MEPVLAFSFFKKEPSSPHPKAHDSPSRARFLKVVLHLVAMFQASTHCSKVIVLLLLIAILKASTHYLRVVAHFPTSYQALPHYLKVVAHPSARIQVSPHCSSIAVHLNLHLTERIQASAHYLRVIVHLAARFKDLAHYSYHRQFFRAKVCLVLGAIMTLVSCRK